MNLTQASTWTDLYISMNLPKPPHATSAFRGKSHCGNGAQDSLLCDLQLLSERVSFMHVQLHASVNGLECSEKLNSTFETNSVYVVSALTNTEARGEGSRMKGICIGREAYVR